MTNGPLSIGVIMDGNRRWAKERGLATFEGHTQGLQKMRDLMSWAKEHGIKEVTVYAFSTENWNRSEEEVGYLMGLFENAFEKQLNDAIENGLRIRFVGRTYMAPKSTQQTIQKIEERTKDGTEGTLIVAFSYGGRAEIVDAVNALIREGGREVTEDEFSQRLWTAGLLEPDLIIRTGGEKRLSNFLPWQGVYSELFFSDTKWPAFTKEEFETILEEYRGRERRRGK